MWLCTAQWYYSYSVLFGAEHNRKRPSVVLYWSCHFKTKWLYQLLALNGICQSQLDTYYKYIIPLVTTSSSGTTSWLEWKSHVLILKKKISQYEKSRFCVEKAKFCLVLTLFSMYNFFFFLSFVFSFFSVSTMIQWFSQPSQLGL